MTTYETPAIIELGSVADFTGGLLGGNFDSLFGAPGGWNPGGGNGGGGGGVS